VQLSINNKGRNTTKFFKPSLYKRAREIVRELNNIEV
jgi:hypothetical protein